MMMSGGLLGDEAVIDSVEFALQSKRLASGFWPNAWPITSVCNYRSMSLIGTFPKCRLEADGVDGPC